MTYNVGEAVPATVGSTGGVRLPHKIGALLEVHDFTAHIGLASGNDGNALQGDVAVKRVLDELPRGRTDGLHVGLMDGVDRGVLGVDVATGEGRVKRASVVVGAADGVESIDGVHVGNLATVAATAVGGASLALDHLERTVGEIAGEARRQVSRPVTVGRLSAEAAVVTPVSRAGDAGAAAATDGGDWRVAAVRWAATDGFAR